MTSEKGSCSDDDAFCTARESALTVRFTDVTICETGSFDEGRHHEGLCKASLRKNSAAATAGPHSADAAGAGLQPCMRKIDPKDMDAARKLCCCCANKRVVTSECQKTVDVSLADCNETCSVPNSSLESSVINNKDCEARLAHVQKKKRTRSLCGPSPVFTFGPKARIMKNSATLLTIQDPGQQRLTWYKQPLTVLIIKKAWDDSMGQHFLELATWLIHEKHMLVFVESSVLEDNGLKAKPEFQKISSQLCTFRKDEDLGDKIDFIICLGGDGTLLYASSLFQESVPPVMAFHLGSLGFLTPFLFEQFRERITNILEGNAMLTLRSRLKCVVVSADSVCARRATIKNLDPKACGRTIVVLNEIVIDRGPSPYLCNIDLFIEGRYITSVQGDGVIISTPTGSTAYAVAAGASMIHPNVPAIMITPICPHSLSFRPIVVPAGVEIKVQVANESRNNLWVSFDGRLRQEIYQNDSICIMTSIHPLPSICSEDTISDWFNSLGECLHWNVRRRQKGLQPPPPQPPNSLSPSPSSISSSIDDLESEDES